MIYYPPVMDAEGGIFPYLFVCRHVSFYRACCSARHALPVTLFVIESSHVPTFRGDMSQSGGRWQ